MENSISNETAELAPESVAKKHRIMDHAVLFALIGGIGLTVFWMIVGGLIANTFLKPFMSETAFGYVESMYTYPYILFLVWFIKKRFSREYRFFANSDRVMEGILIMWPGLVIAAMNVFMAPLLGYGLHLRGGVHLTVQAILKGFQAGFFEETIVRWVVLANCMRMWRDKPNGVLWSAVWSSLAFGMMHLMNLTAGEPVGTVLFQVVYASAIGFMLAAGYLRTNNILSCCIIHGVIDVAAFLFEDVDGGVWEMIIPVVITALGIIGGLIALRKSKQEEIAANFQTM